MLILLVPKDELFDETSDSFITVGPWQLQLEHSLVSVSKWEAIFQKPFLSKADKTIEETKEYIKCMSTIANTKSEAFDYLTPENLEKVKNYINSPMSATVVSNRDNQTPSREVVTAELIYYWMISLNIPFECQKWHLKRLLTLIQVCSIKSSPPKKMSKRNLMSRNKALNDARRAKFNTNG